MMLRTVLLAGAALASSALMPVPAHAQTYSGLDESNCREYTRNVQISGQTVRAYGTACLQQDGSWRIVAENNQPPAVAAQAVAAPVVVTQEPVVQTYAAPPSVVYVDNGYPAYPYYYPSYPVYYQDYPTVSFGFFGGYHDGGYRHWHH